MSLKDVIKRLVVTPEVDPGIKKRLKRVGFRPGMWAVSSEGVGIIVKDLPDGNIEFMLVDPVEGTNRLATSIAASALRQATYREIPKFRRPTQDMARIMGYTV
jgi:hypothetical protein